MTKKTLAAAAALLLVLGCRVGPQPLEPSRERPPGEAETKPAADSTTTTPSQPDPGR